MAYNMVMQKKKVVIIGAGISGLTAGIYLLDNDYDVEIYEKHSIAGGECTGWYRNGFYIDGCAHWIVGTNKNSDFYPLWEHVGAFDENTKIYETDYFLKFKFGREEITIYADLNKLYDELMRVAPEDKKIIKELIRRIEDYQHVRVPIEKPLDMMNLYEYTIFGLHMAPMLYSYLHSRKESLEELSKRAKNPYLKQIFAKVLAQSEYNSHSFYYIMQALSKGDAGVPEGGSLKMVQRIAKRFKDLGGKLFLNSPVNHVIIEENTAKGIVLEDGKQIDADYVIASCDINHTFNKLIGEKYRTKKYKEMFSKPNDYLLNSCIYLSFKTPYVGEMIPKTVCFDINPIKIGDEIVDSLILRSHAFDKSLNKNGSTITSMIHATYKTYEYFKNLSKDDYVRIKNEFGEKVRQEILRVTKAKEEDLELIDVATPLTYEKYCNAYKGSYMSFLTTKRSKWLIQKNQLKGLKNFVLAGQRLMPPGGLPPALFTGKHAAIRISSLDKKVFKNKEKFKSKFFLNKMKNKKKS